MGAAVQQIIIAPARTRRNKNLEGAPLEGFRGKNLAKKNFLNLQGQRSQKLLFHLLCLFRKTVLRLHQGHFLSSQVLRTPGKVTLPG